MCVIVRLPDKDDFGFLPPRSAQAKDGDQRQDRDGRDECGNKILKHEHPL